MKRKAILRARKRARENVDAKIDLFYRQHRADVRNWKLTQRQQRVLELITRKRIRGRALLSNKYVRRAASYALIDAVLELWFEKPERQLYFVTLCWDDGVTWEREPRIEFDLLVNKAQEHLRRHGMDGVGAVETDVWKNITGEPGRRVVAHVHFIGWARNPHTFNRLEVENTLCASLALTNSLDAEPATLREITLTPGDVAHMAYYTLKAPAAAKNPVPCGERFRLEPVSHARGSATRLLEFFSHVELGDVLFSIGNGKKLAAHVRAAIARAVSVTTKNFDAPTRGQIRKFWRDVRGVNGRGKLSEPRIDTRHTRRVARQKLTKN